MIAQIKEIIGRLVKSFGYKIISVKNKSEPFLDSIIEDEFGIIYRKCKDYTMTSPERMFALYKSVEYTVSSRIPGDFVECGVWRGGSAMVIAETLIRMGDTSRKIYLYDTFEGMSKPSDEDVGILDRNKAIDQWKSEQEPITSEWTKDIMAFASLSEVKKNVFSTGYPQKNILFFKGKVEETIPEFMPSQIAVLRLDTDWYESTKHELNFLYPLLVNHGVLIIDDYGHWAGSKKAVDEYISGNKIPILLNRIDYTGRIGIKTDK